MVTAVHNHNTANETTVKTGSFLVIKSTKGHNENAWSFQAAGTRTLKDRALIKTGAATLRV